MEGPRRDGLWWLLIFGAGLEHNGNYWSLAEAAMNHSAVPLHHEKSSISWLLGFVNTVPEEIYTVKISVIC